jgi:dolichol-phosphate mannosyltransferase
VPTGPAISVILPTYNEAESIEAVLWGLRRALDGQDASYEILVLDDASPDRTADRVAAAFGTCDQVRVVRRDPPRGLALSIRDGLERARGETLVVMDADFNHDPADVPRLLASLAEFDLVGGSRFLPGGGMYSRTRQLGSYAMNVFIRAVARTGMRDNLSGFFAVRRRVLATLPAERIFFGYGDFYFRLLWYARRQGARLVEIPVRYPPRAGGTSKTRLLRTSLRYAREAVCFALVR